MLRRSPAVSLFAIIAIAGNRHQHDGVQPGERRPVQGAAGPWRRSAGVCRHQDGGGKGQNRRTLVGRVPGLEVAGPLDRGAFRRGVDGGGSQRRPGFAEALHGTQVTADAYSDGREDAAVRTFVESDARPGSATGPGALRTCLAKPRTIPIPTWSGERSLSTEDPPRLSVSQRKRR